MPTANLSPASEITFRLRPVSAMTTNVPMTEMGMASAISNVGRGRLADFHQSADDRPLRLNVLVPSYRHPHHCQGGRGGWAVVRLDLFEPFAEKFRVFQLSSRGAPHRQSGDDCSRQQAAERQGTHQDPMTCT